MVELKKICNRGELIELAEKYVAECKARVDAFDVKMSKSKSLDRFPNLAGFARYLGVSISTIKKIEGKWPEQYGTLLAIFEDEALNSDKNATILNTYIKERLSFGEKKEGGATLPVGNVQLVFEHDMSEDGA